MNPYASRRQHLKLVCLPISPPPHRGELYEYSKGREGKGMTPQVESGVIPECRLSTQRERYVDCGLNIHRLTVEHVGPVAP